MNANNTKFSSGDTAPKMTAHQARTDFYLGSDAAWQDYRKKLRKRDECLRFSRNFETVLSRYKTSREQAMDSLKDIKASCRLIGGLISPAIRALDSEDDAAFESVMKALCAADRSYLFG